MRTVPIYKIPYVKSVAMGLSMETITIINVQPATFPVFYAPVRLIPSVLHVIPDTSIIHLQIPVSDQDNVLREP